VKLINSFALSTSFVLMLGMASSANAAETYTVDPAHSWVSYRVRHMDVATSMGLFKDVEGNFTLDDQNKEKSTFNFSVKVDSIDSANPKRDAHLKGTDFFNAKQFPTISFKSSKVTKLGEEGYQIVGNLTLHGVTKPVSLKVAKIPQIKGPRGGYVAGLDVDVTIKRSDFGMTNMIPMIGDEVTLVVGIEGTRK
jgi:polyisoprenoid-binding protein YceI